MLDPNQLYVPIAYPRMLYATADLYLIVDDEAQESAARARGYTDFAKIDSAQDGLEHISHEHLIEQWVLVERKRLLAMTTTAIVEMIRERRRGDAALRTQEDPIEGFDIVRPDEYDTLTDDELRAYLTDRDGQKPHHWSKRPALLEMARSGALKGLEAHTAP